MLTYRSTRVFPLTICSLSATRGPVSIDGRLAMAGQLATARPNYRPRQSGQHADKLDISNNFELLFYTKYTSLHTYRYGNAEGVE